MTMTKLLTPYNFTNKNNASRIKYIVIHYFGGTCSAENLAKSWASRYVGASAHYAVGHGGEVFQCVEDEDVAWHCGASKYVHPYCRNSNSIGIEMAVRKKNTKSLKATDKDWYFTEETFQAAVELTVTKMIQYNVAPENVLRHKDVTGKICPNPMVYDEALWAEFRKRITEAWNTSTYRPGNGAVQEAEQKPDKEPSDIRNYLYMVQTTTDVLNIRKGPGTKYPVAGQIRERNGEKKNYRIRSEKDGWGELYSGAGWISLKYARKV